MLLLLELRCRGAGAASAAVLRRQPAVRRWRWMSSGAGGTPPESMGGKLRARVLSALQKDGSKQLDTSLPLGYAQNHHLWFNTVYVGDCTWADRAARVHAARQRNVTAYLWCS